MSAAYNVQTFHQLKKCDYNLFLLASKLNYNTSCEILVKFHWKLSIRPVYSSFCKRNYVWYSHFIAENFWSCALPMCWCVLIYIYNIFSPCTIHFSLSQLYAFYSTTPFNDWILQNSIWHEFVLYAISLKLLHMIAQGSQELLKYPGWKEGADRNFWSSQSFFFCCCCKSYPILSMVYVPFFVSRNFPYFPTLFSNFTLKWRIFSGLLMYLFGNNFWRWQKSKWKKLKN